MVNQFPRFLQADGAETPGAVEINFDGLVGPTHHYAGLSHGNVASQIHRHSRSSPRHAVQEGLGKMKLLAELGVAQAILPPHDRPELGLLTRLGFSGSETEILAKARREAPALLAACASASSMWTANAATVAPGVDTADGRLHLTPANLINELHRCIETPQTARLLRAIFADEKHFAHHPPLPAAAHLGDEGAANHTRLCAAHDQRGIHLLTFGRDALDPQAAVPRRYPARQTRQACEAVARLHQLDPAATLLIQQHPDAIDAGVFHNDVIAVGHRHVLLCHEGAWVDQRATVARIGRAFEQVCQQPLVVIQVRHDELALADAVTTYLFNSQLVDLPGGSMAMICPLQCQAHPNVQRLLAAWVQADDLPITQVHFVDVQQSMRNGGGPACLRLRVVLDAGQQAAVHQGVFLTPTLYDQLMQWSEQHYRDELTLDDLADPHLLEESRTALDELTRLLGLGPVYPFQR